MSLRRLAAFTLLALMSAGAAAHAATITVRVATFKPVKGLMLCRLYSGPTGFPGGKGFQAEQWVTVKDTTATCTFPNLRAGTYAVSLFHDANGNKRLDRNFIGLPTEGVGVSNNRFRTMAPPRFDDDKFQLTGDTTIDIKLRY
jgi:uncharacterized protein (DUF2141 family)